MPPRHTALQPQRLAFINNKQGYHNNITTKKEGEIWNLQVQKNQKRRRWQGAPARKTRRREPGQESM